MTVHTAGWYHPGTCTGNCVATPSDSCGKHCVVCRQGLVSKTPFPAWAAETQLSFPDLSFRWGDAVLFLGLHKMIHLGLSSPITMSLWRQWCCNVTCFHGRVPFAPTWDALGGRSYKRWENRVAQGKKAKLPRVTGSWEEAACCPVQRAWAIEGDWVIIWAGTLQLFPWTLKGKRCLRLWRNKERLLKAIE